MQRALAMLAFVAATTSVSDASNADRPGTTPLTIEIDALQTFDRVGC